MKRALVLALSFLAIAGSLGADPRWWRDGLGGQPRCPGPGQPGRGRLHRLRGRRAADDLRVWEETTAAGDTDIMIDASFDGGCKFCGPSPGSRAGAPGPAAHRHRA